MICSLCAHGATRPGTTTMTVERDGTTLVVRHVPAEICDNCGEEFITGATQLVLEQMLADAIAAHTDVQISHFHQAA